MARQGSCRGMLSSPARTLPGAGGLPRQGSFRESSSSNPHLILNMSSQRSACHHGGASRALAQGDVGDRGLKGGLLCWRWASCPGKALAGAAEVVPARVLPGVYLAPLLFVSLALALLLVALCLRLPSSALLSVAVGAASTVRAQVKGSKGAPLLLYTDRSPRAWATHKRDALLG